MAQLFMTNSSAHHHPRPTLQFYWLTVSAFVALSVFLCYWFKFNGLYGQDSHEYLRYTKALAAYLKGGRDAGNFFWPIIYPLIASVVSFVIPVNYSLQIVSLASAAACYLYFGKTLNLLYPTGTQRQRYAFIFLLCSPFFLRASIIGMSDMLCCALLSATYYHTLKAEKQYKTASLIIATLLGITVIQTRYAAGILLLPLIPTFLSVVRNREHIIPYIVAAAVLALTPSFFLKTEFDTGLLRHPWLTNWSPVNLIAQDFVNQNGTLHYTFPNIVYVLALFAHPGFCFGFLPLMILTIKSSVAVSRWWIIALVLYLFFLAGIPFQNLRFLLPAFPLLLLIIYPGFEFAFKNLRNRTGRLLILLTILTIQGALTFRAIRPFYQYQQEEMQISQELKKLPAVTLYTFAIDGALETYDVPQEVINLWTLSNPMMLSGSMLLYNPSRFEFQFSNTPPGKIYTQMLQQNKLIYIKALPNGWQLYKLR